MMLVGTSCTARTPSVFCAVIAVIALAPYTPSAWNVLRSACMPAPPPESEPAIVRATGRPHLPRPPFAVSFTGPHLQRSLRKTPLLAAWPVDTGHARVARRHSGPAALLV